MFGFVLLAFLILIIVCAETSILLCYFHLCSEDYRWWWRSFFTTGTTGFYLLCFSIHYLLFKTNISGSLSYFLFFGYTFIITLLFTILTGKQAFVRLLLAKRPSKESLFLSLRPGTVGFVACFWFVWKIYSIVKID